MRLTQISCPKCKASLSSKAGIEEGTSIVCPKCKQKFAAAAPIEEVADDFEVIDDFEFVDEDDETPSKKASSRERSRRDEHEERPQKKSARNRNSDDEDDDEPDRPKRRRSVDDENRPAAKKRSRQDDDDDDRPRPKKKKRRKGSDDEELGVYEQLKQNIWVRAGVLGTLLTILGVLAYFRFVKNDKGDDVSSPVVKNDDEELAKPFRPDNRVVSSSSKDLQTDVQKFQGAWSATSATMDGQKYSVHGLRDFRFTVKGDRWYTADSRNSSRSRLEVAKKPAEIDFIHNANVTLPGIYRFIDKDTLEICNRLQPGERPKDFAAPEGSKRVHMILKRDLSTYDPKQIASDADRLKGSWSPSAFNAQLLGTTEPFDGALSAMMAIALQPNGMQNIRLTVTEDELILENGNDSDHYKVDPAKSPTEIDIVHPDGSTSLGICKFPDVNTFELRYSLRGERPRDFVPAPGSDTVYFVFRRNP